MQITRSRVDTQNGPANWFTGDVYIDAVADPASTSTFAAYNVHFTPGAHRVAHQSRTARRSSSPRASGSASARAGRSRGSGPATVSSSSRARTTGVAPRGTAS